MKTTNPKRLKTLAFAIAVLMAISFLSGQLWAAGTAAGERIQNQATATYVDANLNSQTAQSNIATIEVAQVFSASLAEDRSRFAASGQSVNFAHILKNTGKILSISMIPLEQMILSFH